MDISGRINKANSQALRTQMQMIFQDPMASLNPRKKVRDIIGEGLDIHHMYKTRAEREEKIKNILAKLDLRRNMRAVIRISFPVDRDSVSELRER